MQVNSINNGYLPLHVQKIKNSNGELTTQQYSSNSIACQSSYGLEHLQANYMSKSPSFGRFTIEHMQNGAYVDAAKNVFFKLLTFPDVKEVSVVIAKEVNSAKKAGKTVYEITKHAMQRDTSDAAGIFKLQVSPKTAQDGDKYAFEIIKSNGERFLAPDPYALRKTVFYDANGYLDDAKLYRTDRFSEIYDNKAYKWHDEKWRAGLDKRRISVIADDKNGLKSFKEARIYEINIPTFGGDFKSAKKLLEKMIDDGFLKDCNAIEIMPFTAANSKGWSYDPVFLNAVMESLGGADGAKEFIDFGHSKGLNIILDTVPNHFGLDNNLLAETGPYIGRQAEFGPAANLENDFRDNKHVRDYLVNTCGLNWLRDFHFDGIRLDFTHDVGSEVTLRQLTNEVRHHEPHAPVILEDNRVHEASRLMEKLSDEEIALNQPESVHAEIIKRYDTNSVPNNIGATARWGYEYHHALKKFSDGEISASQYRQAMIDAHKRQDVIYGPSGSHDERNDGMAERVRLVRNRLNLQNSFSGSDKDRYQKSAFKAQGLVESLVSGLHPDLRKNSYLAEEYREVDEALRFATARSNVTDCQTATLPNPKMSFQGNLEPFYFFRKNAIDCEKDWVERKIEKGYIPDENAMNASKIGSIKYTKEYQTLFKKADQLKHDVNEFAAKNPAMSKGYIYEDTTVAHDGSRVVGTHLKKDDSETFTVMNMSDFSYNNNYKIQFPQGKWREVINSNNEKYAGSGQFMNSEIITADVTSEKTISLPANSLIIFEKIA